MLPQAILTHFLPFNPSLSFTLDRIANYVTDFLFQLPITYGTEEKFEYYNEGEDSFWVVSLENWYGQIFTPSTTHTITSIKLKLARNGLPHDLTVSIREANEGVPNGDDLCVGTIDGDTLTENETGDWYEITFEDGAVLESGVQYAIICRALEADGDNQVYLFYDGSEATYGDGTAVWSTNYGASWIIAETDDIMFEEWGYSVPSLSFILSLQTIYNVILIFIPSITFLLTEPPFLIELSFLIFILFLASLIGLSFSSCF